MATNNNNITFPAFRDPSTKNNIVTKRGIAKCLFENGLISQDDYLDVCNDVKKISEFSLQIYQCFEKGIVTPNTEKQDGVLNNSLLRFSFNMSGKLDGVIALSTWCLCNTFCRARMLNPDLVCHYCFAADIPYIWTLLNCIQNTYVIRNRIFSDEEIPVLDTEKLSVKFPDRMTRFEAFGDLATYEQAVNYIKTAYKNPNWNFALWTKNPAILARAIDDYGKPGNLSTVLSMSRVDKMDGNYKKWLSYFDHAFVVVRGKNGKEHLLKVYDVQNPYDCQCGPESCIHCRRCYMITGGGDKADTAVELLRKGNK